jgi:hypothetical protein
VGRTTAAPSSESSETTLRSTFFTQQQLCQELPKVTMRKLAYWRANRIGPKWSRIGREIIYFRDSVESYLRANEIKIEREPTRNPRRGSR